MKNISYEHEHRAYESVDYILKISGKNNSGQ